MDRLEAKISQVKAEIQCLEQQEMVCARIWLKAGKYAYLVYPQEPDGSRKREYVGSKPENIQEAEEKIKRYQSWTQAKSDLEELEELYRFRYQDIKMLAARLGGDHVW